MSWGNKTSGPAAMRDKIASAWGGGQKGLEVEASVAIFDQAIGALSLSPLGEAGGGIVPAPGENFLRAAVAARVAQIKTLQFMGKPISALQTLQQRTCGDRSGRFDLQKNLFVFAFHVIWGVGDSGAPTRPAGITVAEPVCVGSYRLEVKLRFTQLYTLWGIQPRGPSLSQLGHGSDANHLELTLAIFQVSIFSLFSVGAPAKRVGRSEGREGEGV